MQSVFSKCLLALAVLQGITPADQCILKLAGVCHCDESVSASVSDSCCHADKAEPDCCHSKHSRPSDRSHKSCCAYSASHLLTATAPIAPSINTHSDCAPTAFADLFEYVRIAAVDSVFPPHGHDSPGSPGPLVYVRVHSFLI